MDFLRFALMCLGLFLRGRSVERKVFTCGLSILTRQVKYAILSASKTDDYFGNYYNTGWHEIILLVR